MLRVIFVACALALVAGAQERPNIVVFLVDDMGWQDTSVAFHREPTPQNAHFRTPHMERLAASGVRFTNAYACAVCSPSRTSLMTGWNAARHHVTNWTFWPDRDQSATTKRLQSPAHWRTDGLQPSDGPSLAQRLHDAGYFTIHAGKAHWGAANTPGADPRNLGFDVNIAGHHAGGPGSFHGEKNYSARWRGDKVGRWDVPGLERYHGLPVHLTDATTLEALRSVDHAIESDQPFFLYLAHYAVHAPIEEHAPYASPYRKEGVDETEARYASMVQGMDASLGAVLRHLERRGVARDTIVLFSSDNGGLSAHGRGRLPGTTVTKAGTHDTHNLPLRAGKGSAYEGGTRVPLLVSWATPDPEHAMQSRVSVPAGAVRHTPTIIEDVFATVLSWANVEHEARDGQDLTPLLESDGAGPRSERPLVFHYPHKWGPNRAQGGYEPHSALRQGGLKVIWFYDRQRWELYDLVEDLGERTNLAARHPDVLRQMAKSLIDRLEALDAQYPVNRTTGQAEPPVPPRS